MDGKHPDAERASLSHLDASGRARMVDVSQKAATARVARAEAVLRLSAEARELLWQGKLDKGEALGVARIAGIQAAKDTARLIPLCHPLPLAAVHVDFARDGDDGVRIHSEASTVAATGVEIEALTAAAVAALTLYDMAKSACRGAVIERIALLHKSGGRSGRWDRPEGA